MALSMFWKVGEKPYAWVPKDLLTGYISPNLWACSLLVEFFSEKVCNSASYHELENKNRKNRYLKEKCVSMLSTVWSYCLKCETVIMLLTTELLEKIEFFTPQIIFKIPFCKCNKKIFLCGIHRDWTKHLKRYK